MRVVMNSALIERNRRLATISFFLSIGTIVASFLLSNWLNANSPDSSIFFNCIVVPMLFFVIIYSVRLSNNWVREPVPWEALSDAVRGLGNSASMYHFIMPGRHVLIAPQGVFALYPMFQDREVIVKDDRWALGGSGLGALMAFMRQEQVGNPTKDALFEAEQTQKLINRLLPDNEVIVEPIIVFTHPEAKVDIEGDTEVPVTFVSADSPKLIDYIRGLGTEDAETLTEDDLDVLDAELIYD